jgi:hypothetical protein
LCMGPRAWNSRTGKLYEQPYGFGDDARVQ